MPKVSAIVPIYGEKTVERCIRSLLGQTLDDIEFIFVDDKSPDSAYERLLQITAEERYASLKDNIKIVRHDVNKGVAAVRRTGWEASTGDYIYHCDSDDWLDPDMLRILWEKAVEGDYDLVECDYMEADGEGHCKKRIPYLPYRHFEDWIESPCTASLWNKIVRRSVYQNEILWPQNAFQEDYILVSQLYVYSKSRYYIDKALYYYYINPSGITASADARKKVEGMKCQIEILGNFMRGKGLYEKYRTRFLVFESEAMAFAWNLPGREFLKLYPGDRLKILLCKCISPGIRLGHLTKLLGIHGIRGKKS